MICSKAALLLISVVFEIVFVSSFEITVTPPPSSTCNEFDPPSPLLQSVANRINAYRRTFGSDTANFDIPLVDKLMDVAALKLFTDNVVIDNCNDAISGEPSMYAWTVPVSCCPTPPGIQGLQCVQEAMSASHAITDPYLYIGVIDAGSEITEDNYDSLVQRVISSNPMHFGFLYNTTSTINKMGIAIDGQFLAITGTNTTDTQYGECDVNENPLPTNEPVQDTGNAVALRATGGLLAACLALFLL